MKTKISLIITALNEERTILALLEALGQQTYLADEIVITDGGSTDKTQLWISQYAQSHPKVNIRLMQAKGNRSVGRNVAIKHTRNECIAITDAGCIPQSNWLSELVKVYDSIDHKEKVVAGYYTAKPKTPFQEAVVPYVLVMPERVDPKTFLPATRSMMMSASVWKILGGFDEKLSDNEDYAFAHEILRHHIPILFAEKAKVEWLPRTTLKQFFWMIFRFARGDIFAGIVRPKVLLIFARYLFAGVFLFGLANIFFFAIRHPDLFTIFLFLNLTTMLSIAIFMYLVWSVKKNAKYVPHGMKWLPVLQVVSDLAVMLGSLAGVLQCLTINRRDRRR